jgi:hypothetical protein
MQDDKQNNPIRSALDGLDQLPEGFAFNSQRAWNGIEEKFPGKKQNRPFWYYAAAAIVLLVGAAYLAFFMRPMKSVAETQAAVAVTHPAVSPVLKRNKIMETDHSAAILNRRSNDKKTTAQKTIIPSPATKEINDVAEAKETPVTAQVEQVPLPVISTEPPIKEDKKKPVLTIAKKPVARQYRIIHLNDLDAMPATNAQNNLTKSELRKIMNQLSEEKETPQTVEPTTRQLFFLKSKTATTTNTIVENN